MRRLALCFAPFLLAGCAMLSSQPSAPSGPTPDDNLNAVLWTRTSMEHDLIYREVYHQAAQQLAKALADPSWDALSTQDRHNNFTDLPPAVVLDIDETVLDNSPYEAKLARDHGQYSSATWADWVREQKAKALPGALAFARYAAAHGVQVIYLSNRAQDLDKPTLANLKADGFPVSGDDAFLGLGTSVSGCTQHGTSKHCRRVEVGRHYRVLVQVGDQMGDFLQLRGTPAARKAELKPYLDWFGQRWFVLPNPTYGDWESAAFGGDYSLTPAQRRAAKLKALRYP
ncbi:MAG TPA: HAD family acid phosphatase [Rhodanobacteraceae bacterium]